MNNAITLQDGKVSIMNYTIIYFCDTSSIRTMKYSIGKSDAY